jgi:hypothetical protein
MKQIITSLLLLAVVGKVIAQAECCTAGGSFLTELYNTQAGWTFFDQGDGLNNIMTTSTCSANTTENGGITINNGRLNFNALRNAREVRLYRNMNATLSNTAWTADFVLTINPTVAGQLSTNIPSVHPLVFSSNTGPMRNGCTGQPQLNTTCSGGYTWSNNNAIAVTLASPFINNCGNTTPNGSWTFTGFAKWGTTTYSSGGIPLTAATTYYVRLQRVSAGFARISVFSDPGYCNHLPNSPQCFAISPNITGLSFLHHENVTGGSWLRIFNGSMDNLRVDNGPSCGYQSATAGPDYIDCNNPLTNFTLGNANNPTGPGYTYSWTPSTNVTGATNGPTLTVTNNTTVTYTMNYTAGGCPFSDNVVVAAPVTVDAGPDVLNCNGNTQSVWIGNVNNPPPPQQTYVWSSSNPNVTFGLNPQGTAGGATGTGSSVITVTATNQFGCTATDALLYQSVANAGPDRVYCHYNNGGGVMIGGDYPALPGYTYSWTASPASGAGIDCATCPRTLVNPLSAINTNYTYTLTVTSPSGQSCTDQVVVSVQNNLGNPMVNLPLSHTVNCANPGATVLNATAFSSINAITSYAWHSMTTPAINNLSSTTVPNPSFTNCNNGTNPAVFFITVRDVAGCEASAKTVVSYTGFPPSSGNRTAGIPIGGVKGGAAPPSTEASKGLRVFPTPNKGRFTIQAPAGKRLVKAVIRNAEGRVVKWYDRINGPQLLVYLRSGSSGVYLAEMWLEGDDKSIVQKVLVGQ